MLVIDVLGVTGFAVVVAIDGVFVVGLSVGVDVVAALIVLVVACRLGDSPACGPNALKASHKSTDDGSNTTAGILFDVSDVVAATPGSRLKKSSAGSLVRWIMVAEPVVVVVAVIALAAAAEPLLLGITGCVAMPLWDAILACIVCKLLATASCCDCCWRDCTEIAGATMDVRRLLFDVEFEDIFAC